ncbi:MAG: AAA family ATPase, partial [Pseudomonadota bacterium]
MQFTRLRLQGFKSFVDPTEMLIEPGLTGVVGPNGCGKSNLLEALRWVMGEGRASAMRGGAMDDVIFAGATGRPARNHAEVGVILDNTARTAPSGFNDSDALEVVRRITRDVGSAYKANGREARARDVQMLFADASTGALSPALVRQGQISEIISAKPKARRRVLEEAAGISGLYQRRHEAELRLRAADANLVRLDDVLEALRGQMVALTRQARQAARYRELAEALRRAEGQLLFRRWLEAAGALEAAEAEERSTLTAVAKAEGGARAAARALEAAEAALPPKREETAIAGAIVQRLALEREALDARADRAAEAIEALDRQIAEVDADAEREAALNRDAEEVMTRLAAEERDLDDADARHPERLAGAEAAANRAATDLAEGESALETARSTAAALSAEAAAGARRLAVAEEAVARAEKAQAAATTAATAIQAEIDAARAANETAAAAHKATETAAATADAALATAEAAAAAAQAKESEARSEHAAAEGQARTLEAEVTALAGLIAEDRSGGGILEEVTVAPGFERALGAAFGDDLAAPRAVAGGAGWDEIAGAEAAALPAGIESLAPHVAAPAALDRRLKATGVVAQGQGTDLQRSLAPGHRLVSLEGDLWRWDGYSATAE